MVGPSIPVEWALTELDLPYAKEVAPAELLLPYLQAAPTYARDLRAAMPELARLNPHASLPTLQDDDSVLFEQVAILLHLGERYGVAKGLWPAGDTVDRAAALSWTLWSTTELFAAAYAFGLHGGDYAPHFLKEHRSDYAAGVAKQRWNEHLDALDAHLSSRPYMIGGAFGLVDVATSVSVVMGPMKCNLTYHDYRHVVSWVERCQTRPHFQQVVKDAYPTD